MVKRKNGITVKMITLVILSLVISGIFFSLSWFISSDYLSYHFASTSYIYDAETDDIASLQKYVSENNIAATDEDSLRAWTKDHNTEYITVSRDRILLYGSSNLKNYFLIGTYANDLHATWMYFHEVTFSDGVADVFIYNGYAEKYYYYTLLILAGASVFLFIFIILLGVYQNVKRLKQIYSDVERMQQNDYETQIAVKGKDEIAAVANQLEHMRTSILLAREQEVHLKKAQDELLLGLAHDLRTPLTSQMSYLELLNSSQEINNENRYYAQKALRKTQEIRDLSDQLFEYFLTTTSKKYTAEEPQEVKYAIGDYLSDMIYTLERSGFQTDSTDIRWESMMISVCLDYLGRINNNLISNIIKYADPSQPVRLWINYTNANAEVHISNSIRQDIDPSSKTGIGLKNVEMMMNRMSGRLRCNKSAKTYETILEFPGQ